MSGARIFRLRDLPVVDRGNGITSIPLVGADTGAERLLTGMTIIPPRGEIPLHVHSSEECIVIMGGRGSVDVEGKRHDLVTGDATYVPAGMPHRFVNLSDAPLQILWIYSDVNATRTFVETGETAGHLDKYEPPSATS